MSKTRWHSKLCKWDGKSTRFTWRPGECLGCDELKTEKITNNLFKGNYGIGKDELHIFCLSGIKWARCTKHTNPSCACGKIVLNATA
jgi:hypothetical protein